MSLRSVAARFSARLTVEKRKQLLAAAGGVAILVTFVAAGQLGQAADTPPAAAHPQAATPSAAGRLPDGRENASQVRFDNLLMVKVPGWNKRKEEWKGQWTLEHPEFKTNRVQITAKWAVGLDEKGMQALADAQTQASKQYIDFKEEAPPRTGTHPAGYKTLTTFTSVSAPGYGKDCRLYTVHVYLEANGLASAVEYSAAYRENFDKYKPLFDDFMKNVRLLSAQTLAPAFDDQPPLEQFTVNQCCDFVEWLLDVPLTDTQREAARDHFTQVWTRHDKEEASGLWDVFKARNELDQLSKEKKELGRQAARVEVIKQWREEAAKGDKMAAMMVEVYDRAQKPLAAGKPGEPALTRQQADATIEILHFMASKVAGADVGPSEEQKAEFATKLAARYGEIDADAKKELEQMPLYWAWLRAAWPEVPAEERAKMVEQWSKAEQIRPIVAKIEELKAKGMAGDSLDAMRRLYQQQQTVAAISNMMAMQHRTNMTIINNIGSSNYRYEYKYVYRYR